MALVCTDEDINGITLVSRDPRLDLQKNPFPPVFRLPTEILANIFIHNARNSFVHEMDNHSSPTTPSWVNVSYICCHWRDIALNCQILWTYISTTESQRWTQELLARSKKTPLKIYTKLGFDVDRGVLVSVVEELMNHSQRIEELHFDFLGGTGIEQCSYQILSKFLSSCLPSLQHLGISKDFCLLERESSFSFEGNTPALRTLILDCGWMAWKTLEISAWTTLQMRYANFPLPKNVTIAEFLAMLRRMPQLVQLSVHRSLPIARDSLSNGEFNTAPMVNLSHLSNMSITAPISTINTLLSCVDIPPTTKVELGCEGSFIRDDITRLASLLAHRINPSCDSTPIIPKFRSLTVNNNNTIGSAQLAFTMSERGYSFPSSVFPSGPDENTRLLVCLSPVDSALGCSAISSQMCSSIPLTDIESVHFVGPTSLLDFWRNMLTSFPNVRYIKLTGCCMPNIASMLSLPSHNCWGDEDGPVDEDQNEIFVPALEELELYKITFSRVDSRSDLDTLCEAISTRKETQCGLTLKDCRMATREHFEALELVARWKDTQFKVTHL